MKLKNYMYLIQKTKRIIFYKYSLSRNVPYNSFFIKQNTTDKGGEKNNLKNWEI